MSNIANLMGFAASDDINFYRNNVAYLNPDNENSGTLLDISSISSVGSQASLSNPDGFCFNSFGDKLYVLSGTNINQFYQASFQSYYFGYTSEATFSVSSQTSSPEGIHLSEDGTKFYVCDTANDRVYQYTLSTAYDISTASYDSKFLDTTAGGTYTLNAFGVHLSPDGKTVIVADASYVFQYSLTTPWDISTGVYVDRFDVGSQTTSNRGVSLDYSGTVMLIGGTTPDAVFKYNLSTPWQVNTATYSQTYNTAGQETSVSDVFVRPDGMSLFFSGTSSDRVWGYRVNNTSLSVGGQETNPTGVFFKPDGTKMYITGTTGDDVTQYTLSTPWDLGSKSHDGQSSVSSYETTPNGVYISPDGAYLFISGDIGNDVNRFAISTPWDVTSGLSYQQAFSVAGQASNVRDLWFKPDGTKMYIAENSNNVIQYSLTTPWSLTTASLEKEQTVTSSEASSIAGIAFSEDGTKLFCTDDTNNNTRDIVSFVLSTPWDIATLTYEGRIPSYDFAPKGLYLSPDGEHLAMVDQLYDRVKPFKFEA